MSPEFIKSHDISKLSPGEWVSNYFKENGSTEIPVLNDDELTLQAATSLVLEARRYFRVPIELKPPYTVENIVQSIVSSTKHRE